MSCHPFKHFVTITKHRHQVIRNGMTFGIFWHCLRHDLTKYGWTEFHLSAKYYAGTYSPVFNERLHNDYFSLICQHHTKRNKHHWEYWADFLRGRILAKQMPYVYAVEYVCDVLAASKVYNGKNFTPKVALDYFMGRKEHYYMAEGTKQFISWLLTKYVNEGKKGINKKEMKAKYQEISSKYPEVEVFDIIKTDGKPLPELIKD